MYRYIPKYIQSYESGLLRVLKDELHKNLENCQICPHKCMVNRLSGEIGHCKTGRHSIVASYGPHFGEENMLVGNNGSGTIFFSYCNLLCIFCQNYDISHEGYGVTVDDQQLSEIMLSLQKAGCHNINLVTPTHVTPQIVNALFLAIEKGLNIPIVYNTSTYDDLNTIRLLSGIIDIYMPDLKFMKSNKSEKLCNSMNYFDIAKNVILEMYRQAGTLKINSSGIATSGLLIRHLVMPNNMSDTKDLIDFISDKISKDTYINIMQQYRPEGKAYTVPELSKPLEYIDYIKAKEYAMNVGLKNLL